MVEERGVNSVKDFQDLFVEGYTSEFGYSLDDL